MSLHFLLVLAHHVMDCDRGNRRVWGAATGSKLLKEKLPLRFVGKGGDGRFSHCAGQTAPTRYQRVIVTVP